MIGRTPPPSRDEPSTQRGFDDYDLRLGDVMRGERATLGKSLLDVQRELRIKATFIAAIENADASAFETPGFVAGYVRSYAKYLGLDPEWAYAKFCAEANFQTPNGLALGQARAAQAREKPRMREGRDPIAEPGTPFAPRSEAMLSQIQPGALGSMLVLLLLIGGLGYGGWSVLQEVQRVQFAPVEQAPGVISELDPLESATVVAVAPEASGVRAPTSPELLDRLYRPQALEVPVMTARDGPIATLDPGAVGVLPPEPEEPVVVAELAEPEAEDEIAEIQVVDAGPPVVTMFAVQPAWVRVRAADNTVILEKILERCERFTLPLTEEPPTLRAGNAGAVYFDVAGQTYGPAGAPGSVTNVAALGPEDVKAGFQVADLEANQDLARVVADMAAPDPLAQTGACPQ